MNKVAISNIKDFNNFKINMRMIGGCCNKNTGGGFATNNLNMNEFLGSVLPKLKGGYRDYKLNKNKKYGGEVVVPFNLFKDVLSPTLGSGTSTNTTSDLVYSGYNYPSMQNLTRTSF